MLGQAIGPVIGGILSQYLGFRSILWFLTIAGGMSFLSILVLLPETLRPMELFLSRVSTALHLHAHGPARCSGRGKIGTGEVQGHF